jgi:hypothetical protein
MSSGSNIFLIASLIFAGLIVAIAVGVFLYDRLLQHTLTAKQTELATAQASVNEDTVEEFVRLRDRLSSGKDLLNNHVELSQFFTSLESLTLQNVGFTSMKLSIAGDKSAKLQMEGTARNFNALAAQSNVFAGEKRIKRAIFSGITLNDQKQVEFTLTADIDPRLITANPSTQPVQQAEQSQVAQPLQPVAPPVTTTAATTTAATTTP